MSNDDPTATEHGQRGEVFIGIPAHGGSVVSGFALALAYSIQAMAANGWPCRIQIVNGCADIELARATLCQAFMAGNFTHMLQIDADLEWDGNALPRMLASGHDFVAGVYPVKHGNPYTEPEFSFNARGVRQTAGRLWEADRVGGGFVLVKRKVISKLMAAHPELMVHRPGNPDPIPFLWLKKTQPELVGEDFSFGDRWRDLGGRIMIDPDITFRHFGQAAWEGNLKRDHNAENREKSS